jgi:hypothetical protein
MLLTTTSVRRRRPPTFRRFPVQAPLPDDAVLPQQWLRPTASSAKKGHLATGALAWVFCQTSGSKVYTTSMWDRLDDRYYVTNYYLAIPSKTTFTRAIARC